MTSPAITEAGCPRCRAARSPATVPTRQARDGPAYPCASRLAMMPVSTSPVPPVAMPEVPVVLIGLSVRRSHDGVPLEHEGNPVPGRERCGGTDPVRCARRSGCQRRDISPDAGSARLPHRAASRRNHRPRTAYSAHRHPPPAVLPILPTNGEAIWHLLQNDRVPDLRPAHRGFWRAPAPARGGFIPVAAALACGGASITSGAAPLSGAPGLQGAPRSPGRAARSRPEASRPAPLIVRLRSARDRRCPYVRPASGDATHPHPARSEGHAGEQMRADAVLPAQRCRDADGADHHPAGRLGAGVLHQASLQEGEAYRHRGRDARLVPRAGIGVQSARNIRGHNRQAAVIGGLDQRAGAPSRPCQRASTMPVYAP